MAIQNVPGNQGLAGFDAVIFDMDGVIVDSEPYHERAFVKVMREIGYGDSHGIRFDDYLGRSDDLLWVDFVKRHKPTQTVEELMAIKQRLVIRALQEEEPIFDGLPEVVSKLAERCPLAVASGSRHPVIEAVLDLKRLRQHFSAVVSAADVVHGKPAPDIFLRAAWLLKVEPSRCWVIEDSKPGVAAALAAGMRVIAITNTHPPDQLAQATCVVETYDQIECLLLGQGPPGTPALLHDRDVAG